MCRNVIHRRRDREDFVSICVWNLDGKLVFKSQHNLQDMKLIRNDNSIEPSPSINLAQRHVILDDIVMNMLVTVLDFKLLLLLAISKTTDPNHVHKTISR